MSKKKPPPRQPPGIVPGDGKAPGDFREKWERQQWRREWAGTPEEERQRYTHTYLEHHGSQMKEEGRWTCRCPACVATRKHCYLEYWQAKELEEQASQQWHQTSDQYEAFEGSAKAKNQLLGVLGAGEGAGEHGPGSAADDGPDSFKEPPDARYRSSYLPALLCAATSSCNPLSGQAGPRPPVAC